MVILDVAWYGIVWYGYVQYGMVIWYYSMSYTFKMSISMTSIACILSTASRLGTLLQLMSRFTTVVTKFISTTSSYMANFTA